MITKDRTWLSSRASLGEALTTIGVADVAGIELAPLSESALVFKYNGFFYRFAINKWQARRMTREQALLERIGPRLSCKVPEIIDSSHHPVFHAYRGIEGVEIDKMRLAGLEPSQRDRVLMSLARLDSYHLRTR